LNSSKPNSRNGSIYNESSLTNAGNVINLSVSRNSIANNNNSINSVHPSFLSSAVHTPNISNVVGNYISGNSSGFYGSYNSNAHSAVNSAEKNIILEKSKPLSVHTPNHLPFSNVSHASSRLHSPAPSPNNMSNS